MLSVLLQAFFSNLHKIIMHFSRNLWRSKGISTLVISCVFLILILQTSNAYDQSTSLTSSGGNGEVEKVTKFWKGVYGEDCVSKLSSFDVESFNSNHSETFIMLYANWCRASKLVKEEFAGAAQEIAYTEGHTHVRFGALDCNATLANRRVCNLTFNVSSYPSFLYFKNGQLIDMFPSQEECPVRTEEIFYNWIVHGRDKNVCSRYMHLYNMSAVSVANSILPKKISGLPIAIILLYIHMVSYRQLPVL